MESASVPVPSAGAEAETGEKGLKKGAILDPTPHKLLPWANRPVLVVPAPDGE